MIISHRGNLTGANPDKENHPDYIRTAMNLGYSVELDVWFIDGNYVLGHDKPQYEVDYTFIKYSSHLWCHAKNVEALKELLRVSVQCFWHQDDDYTVTSKGFIWVYPGKKLVKNCIAVLPETAHYSDDGLKACRGICTDYPIRYGQYY